MEGEINSLNSKIANAEKNGDLNGVQELKNELSDITLQRNDIVSAQTELSAIGNNTEKVFTFNYLGSNADMGTFDVKNNVGIISYFSFANVAHELKHASDYERGITKSNGNGMYRNWGNPTPLDLEVGAYRSQYSVGGSMPLSDVRTPIGFNDVDKTYVRGIYKVNSLGNKEHLYQKSGSF